MGAVRTAGVLAVSVRCAPASPCTEDFRLTVPADTAAAVRQPAGRIVVAGLACPLRITAENADISASGLRSPDLAAVITAGHLSATFSAPPPANSICCPPDSPAVRDGQLVAAAVPQLTAAAVGETAQRASQPRTGAPPGTVPPRSVTI